MNASLSTAAVTPPTPTSRRIGSAVVALVTLFMLADAASQLLAAPPVLAAAASIGFPATVGLWQAIGGALLISALLYAIPATSFFGAVLITGYLGGAVCAHVRVGEDILVPTIVSALVVALAWAGLAMRDARLRAAIIGR